MKLHLAGWILRFVAIAFLSGAGGGPVLGEDGSRYDEALLKSSRERSLRILRLAMETAATVVDPEPLYEGIASAAAAVHGEGAPAILDEIASRFKKWESGAERWPDSATNGFAALARFAAAFSINKRDEFLERALARPKRVPPDDRMRRLFAFERRLWKSVLKYRKQPADAVTEFRVLHEEASEADLNLQFQPGETQHIQFCHFFSYRHWLTQWLTWLAPEFCLEALPEAETRDFYREARRLHRDFGGRNRLSAILIRNAIEQGELTPKKLELYQHYGLEDLYKRVKDLPRGPESDRETRLLLSMVLEAWAWKDADKALALAEQIEDPDCRQWAIHSVAVTWAYLRPDQIDRAIQKLEDRHVKRRTRATAREELGLRQDGRLPTVSPETIYRGDFGRRMTRSRFACPDDEREAIIEQLVKVLRDPDLDQDRLYEMSCLFIYDKQRALRLIRPNRYYRTRQAYLVRVIHNMGYWGDHDLGEELLEELKDPTVYVRSACGLAKHAVKRRFEEHGKDKPRIRI